METILRCYKMIYDEGFAPNPENNLLTLATCKAYMRRVAKPDEWIAGFTSKSLTGDDVGNERLIYLMRVVDKKSFYEYFNAQEYKGRKDNIYYKEHENDEEYKRLNDDNHNDDNYKSDMISDQVLISDNENGYYFGHENPLSFCKSIRPRIPTGPSPYGWITKGDDAERFIKWVQGEAKKMKLPEKSYTTSSKSGCKR